MEGSLRQIVETEDVALTTISETFLGAFLEDWKVCVFLFFYNRSGFQLSRCRKTKTKAITTDGQWQQIWTEQINENSKQIHVTGAKRGKTRDQASIDFGLASDWLSRWPEFSKPIIERSKAKLKQLLSTPKWKPLYVTNRYTVTCSNNDRILISKFCLLFVDSSSHEMLNSFCSYLNQLSWHKEEGFKQKLLLG